MTDSIPRERLVSFLRSIASDMDRASRCIDDGELDRAGSKLAFAGSNLGMLLYELGEQEDEEL